MAKADKVRCSNRYAALRDGPNAKEVKVVVAGRDDVLLVLYMKFKCYFTSF